MITMVENIDSFQRKTNIKIYKCQHYHVTISQSTCKKKIKVQRPPGTDCLQ